MSIQSVIGAFFAAALLSIASAGVGWAGDPSQKDADETASVDAAPAAADEAAGAEKAEAADAEKPEAESD